VRSCRRSTQADERSGTTWWLRSPPGGVSGHSPSSTGSRIGCWPRRTLPFEHLAVVQQHLSINPMRPGPVSFVADVPAGRTGAVAGPDLDVLIDQLAAVSGVVDGYFHNANLAAVEQRREHFRRH